MVLRLTQDNTINYITLCFSYGLQDVLFSSLGQHTYPKPYSLAEGSKATMPNNWPEKVHVKGMP
jgi:hypothetical protein